MTIRGGSPESFSSVEGGTRQSGNVVVDLAEMQEFQRSDMPQNNVSSKILERLQLIDEMAKKPVCEESVCIGEVRHVDVYSTANFAQDQFELLDKNRDGFIKDDEITAYQDIFKEHMTPRMKGHLDSLRSNYDSTMSLSNDEWGIENDGITRDDLRVLEDREDGLIASQHIKEFVAKHFDETDTNKNGYVTADEIKAYEKANEFKLEHPVHDRDALKVIGHLAEDRNYAKVTGDFLGMTDYSNSGRGLTRAQVSQSAEIVKNGVKGFSDPFFLFEK